MLDVLVGSEPFSLCFLKASTHGVLTRMLVKSLYTPSVLQTGVTWKRRSAGEQRRAEGSLDSLGVAQRPQRVNQPHCTLTEGNLNRSNVDE